VIERVPRWAWPFIILVGLCLSPCIIPLLPVEFFGGTVLYMAQALVLLSHGLIHEDRTEVRRGVQTACFAAICLGFALIWWGLILGWENSFVSPSNEQEKRLGRWLAYLGGAIAGVSAIAAYFLDSSRQVSLKKPLSDDLAD
jgi:cytochrome c biogenesis protein CcdA